MAQKALPAPSTRPAIKNIHQLGVMASSPLAQLRGLGGVEGAEQVDQRVDDAEIEFLVDALEGVAAPVVVGMVGDAEIDEGQALLGEGALVGLPGPVVEIPERPRVIVAIEDRWPCVGPNGVEQR